jgi:GDP-L-fucose synthase
MYADDVADACLFLMKQYNDRLFVNVGTGEEVPIKELAHIIKDVVGFKGQIRFDTSKPDGTPRKLMDSSRLHQMGWRHKVSLREGLERTYPLFIESAKTGVEVS